MKAPDIIMQVQAYSRFNRGKLKEFCTQQTAKDIRYLRSMKSLDCIECTLSRLQMTQSKCRSNIAASTYRISYSARSSSRTEWIILGVKLEKARVVKAARRQGLDARRHDMA